MHRQFTFSSGCLDSIFFFLFFRRLPGTPAEPEFPNICSASVFDDFQQFCAKRHLNSMGYQTDFCA